MLKNILTVILTLLTCASCSAQKAGSSHQSEEIVGDVYKTKSGKSVSFTFIKHASLEIKYDGLSIQVDPVTKLPPETDYNDFGKADFIFVTHEHFDHFDKDAIETLTGDKTQVILNKRCADMLGSGKAMSNGDILQLRSDISVEAVPAYNLTPDRTQFHPKGRDNGYVIDIDGVRVYIAGDTEDVPEMRNLKDIDIAFLPCNQPYTMTPQQLANAARMFQPQVVYPYHYSETPINDVKKLLEGSNIKVEIRNMK